MSQLYSHYSFLIYIQIREQERKKIDEHEKGDKERVGNYPAQKMT